MPAITTEVMVTVVKPPTIMGGNILLIRYSFSSGVSARALQVFSVIIALGGNPYRAVNAVAKASRNGMMISIMTKVLVR